MEELGPAKLALPLPDGEAVLLGADELQPAVGLVDKAQRPGGGSHLESGAVQCRAEELLTASSQLSVTTSLASGLVCRLSLSILRNSVSISAAT